jgi:hypothetical protein
MNVVEDVALGCVSAVIKSFGDWRLKAKRKQRLRDMLTDPRFGFGRTIGRLAAGIGADVETTQGLLVEIGARPSETNADLWTLRPAPTRRAA